MFNGAQSTRLVGVNTLDVVIERPRVLRHVAVKLGAVEDAHDHDTSAVSALVLGQVVAARELFTTVGALGWQVVSIEWPGCLQQ